MAVHIAPVAYVIDDYPAVVFVNGVYDPIVTDADTIQLLGRTQFTHPARKRVLLQSLNVPENAHDQSLRQRAQVFLDRWFEDHLIGCHLLSIDASSLPG